MRTLIYLLSLFLLPVSAGEAWLREHLWKHASYTNSASIDRQLNEWSGRGRWDIAFIGDSEVRWGINPIAFSSALSKAGQPRWSTFNHAFDGFGGSWWSILIPHVFDQDHPANRPRFIALGVQMIEDHYFWDAASASQIVSNCGDLQKPVLKSPYAIDKGLHRVCDAEPDPLGAWVNDLVGQLWLIRYRSAVKSLVIPPGPGATLAFNSAKSGEGFQGYEPHRPIAVNPEEFEAEFERWKHQFEGHPQALTSLPVGTWERLVDYGGYFDRMAALIRATGAEPIFFALPTNPLVIDFFHRREDYAKNTKLLKRWAADRGEILVNLGIEDRANARLYFSDMRHLSYLGAGDFSGRLAVALSEEPVFRQRAGLPAARPELNKHEVAQNIQ